MKRSSARLQDSCNVTSSDVAIDFPSRSKSKKKMKMELSTMPEVKIEKNSDSVNETDSTWDLSFSEIPGEEPRKRKKKKKKSKRLELEDPPEEEIVESKEILEPEISDAKQANGVINDIWPAEKIQILLRRMKNSIPEGDSLKFSSRLTKIDWDALSFDNYSGSDCEKMWKRIQESSRCYRLLEEIIADAEGDIQQPTSTLYQRLRTAKHPARPPKPLTSFMLFFMDKKQKIMEEKKGISGAEVAKRVAELWRDISPKKLEKYKVKAQKLREEYDKKLAKFYAEHPECIEEPKRKKKVNLLGFEKPKSAFQLYLSSCRETDKVNDEKQFYEICKTNWKNMAETDKVGWIKAAQEEEVKFRSNLKKYESEHPGFVPPAVKTLITKNDRHVLENCKGKPKKPPCNAYSLYSVIMLQSNSLKSIPSKERLAEIAKRWKSLSQNERDEYTHKLQKIQEEYAEKYSDYLNSLSPEERMEEEAKNKPSKKKLQVKIDKDVVPEPPKPPIDVLDLFRSKSEQSWKRKAKEDPVVFARKKWEKLSDAQKIDYIRELKNINEEYVDNYGKFLQQCSPDKITEYLNAILQHKKDFQDNLKNYAEFDISDEDESGNNSET